LNKISLFVNGINFKKREENAGEIKWRCYQKPLMFFVAMQIFHNFRNWLIYQSGLSWTQNRGDWTSKIKEYFGNLGKAMGYKPIITSADTKEYLVDIVWVCEKPDRYLSLAMGSELSERKSDILEDFTKLVDIKAHLKIGLFRTLFVQTKIELFQK
jgi:hypothetical protein